MSTFRFASLAMLVFALPSSAATVTWKPDATGDWFDKASWSAGRTPAESDDVVIAGSKSIVKLGKSTPRLGSLVVAGKLVVSGWDTAILTGSLTVKHGGILTQQGPFELRSAANRVQIECEGTLTVEAGGAIDVNGKGYAGGAGHARDDDSTSAGYGPGAGGFPITWGASAGGSHGGRGGTPWASNPCGDEREPLEPGSGGGGGSRDVGGHGGGAIRIAAKDIVVNGIMSANGGDGVSNTYGAGGSGGSILLRCQTVTGQGSITADGGTGSIYAGGGGGGRIAVSRDEALQKRLPRSSQVKFSTVGGANGIGMYGTQQIEHFGQPGTVWFSEGPVPGHIVPLSAQVVGKRLPEQGLRHQTIAYWMPWKVNTPIATIRKELHRKHPKPKVAALFSVQYVGPKLEMMSVESVEVRDDVANDVRRRLSFDNGRTWSKPEPLPPSDIYYDKIEASEGSGAMEYDPRAGVLLQSWLRQFRVGNAYHNTSYYAISRDFGKTWSPRKQFRYEDGPSFDPKNPLTPGYLNKNQGYTGNNILLHSNGTVITALACTNAPNDPQNDSRSWRMGSRCFVGRWNAKAQDYDWQAGKGVEITPDISVRGLLEPEVAELKDGRVFVAYRGANLPGPEGGNLKAKVPGRRWYSVSNDGGITHSEVRELTYDDGIRFYSPSSIHRMIRHSKTGKLYWIGNINPVPPDGNLPRFPLVIAEVDETIPALKRHTVTTIDDRDERNHGFVVQFSNFSPLENRETGELELYLTNYGTEPSQEDWATADNYRYRLTLK